MGEHRDAALVGASLKMATTTRGGQRSGTISHKQQTISHKQEFERIVLEARNQSGQRDRAVQMRSLRLQGIDKALRGRAIPVPLK